MSTRKTGNDFQLWCAAWLRARGWTVRNFPVTVQPRMTPAGPVYAGQRLDVWGADMVARLDGRHAPQLLWVQASCSGGVAKRVRDFCECARRPLIGEWFMLFIKAKPGTVNVHLVDVQSQSSVPAGKIISRRWYAAFSGGPLDLTNDPEAGPAGRV